MAESECVSINTDTEISSISEDRLGRVTFAERVSERIAAAGTGPSVVFGLAGPWGAGKTSVLRMIEELLHANHSDDWSVVRFTPWSAGDVQALTDEFYNSIAAAMPDTEPGKTAARKVLGMAPVAIAVTKAAGLALVDKYVGEGASKDVAEAFVDSAAEAAGKFKITEDPFVTKFTRVSDAIGLAGRNVLVVVDDIDRLHADELLAVLKAVRLLGRFNGVHYLLSYDEQTVLDVLEASDIANRDRARAHAYLEKIIQYPFVLPPLQEEHLQAELRASLEDVARIHALDLGAAADYRGNDPVDTVISAIPLTRRSELTLRSIRRLASQVDVLFTLVGRTELNFVDAVLVTYLRLHYRQLYDRLPQWRHELAGRFVASFDSNRDRSQQQWGQLVAEALGLDPVRAPIVQELLRLLGTLFPRIARRDVSAGASTLCIFESDYFPRYFAFGMPVSDLADELIQDEWTALCNTGCLPEGSAIERSFSSYTQVSLVLRKVMNHQNVVDTASAETALAAAVCLGHLVYGAGRRSFGWPPILYALLRRAIVAADTPEAAVRYLDGFAHEFGLAAAARLLERSRGEAPEIQSLMSASSVNLRARILEACERDLIADVLAETPGTPTLLDFVDNLDSGQWGRLRMLASRLLVNEMSTVCELAGRFVAYVPEDADIEGRGPYRFFVDAFTQVVPTNLWTVPETQTEAQAAEDGSLASRVRFGTTCLREVLGAQGAD